MDLIPLAEVLDQTNEKDRVGRLVPFSISFYVADGSLRKLTNAVRCAVKGDQKQNRILGVRSLAGGHPYPVFYNWITEFNNKQVTW